MNTYVHSRYFNLLFVRIQSNPFSPIVWNPQTRLISGLCWMTMTNVPSVSDEGLRPHTVPKETRPGLDSIGDITEFRSRAFAGAYTLVHPPTPGLNLAWPQGWSSSSTGNGVHSPE